MRSTIDHVFEGASWESALTSELIVSENLTAFLRRSL